MTRGAAQSMRLAVLLMAGSVLLSRFMGLARDQVVAFTHGAALEADIYFTAFVIPDFLNYLLAGGYFSITLIPMLAEAFARDEAEGWRFFSAVFTWLTLAAVLLTGAAMVLAPELARWAAPGFDEPALRTLTRFLRIILPAQVCFLAGSCLTAVLYLRKRFTAPALSPLVYNGGIILGGLLFPRLAVLFGLPGGAGQGMEGFCWGVLGGAFLGNFLLPLMAVIRSGVRDATGPRGEGGAGLRYRPRLWHPAVKRFLLLALPLMLGQSVVVLDEQLARVFGSLAGEGAVSWLTYARRIMLVPVGVVAQAAGVASYPFLASLLAKGDEAAFGDTCNTALRNTVAVLLPLSLWMLAAAEPTIALLFQQGRFGPEDTATTALCLRILLAGVACWGVQQLVGRAFYARQDTVSPAALGTLATLAALPVYWLLGERWGAPGVALASCLSVGGYALALSLWWRRRHGGAIFQGLGRLLGRGLLASLPAAVAAWGTILALAPLELHVLLGARWLEALCSLAASGLAFLLVCLTLGRRLAPEAMAPLLELAGKVRRRLPGR